MSTYSSPHAALAHSVRDAIYALTTGGSPRISGIVNDSIRVRKVPDGSDFVPPNNAHALPAILITYADREQDLGGLNNRDDISYPLTVVFASADVTSKGTADPEANDDLYLGWRQTISDVFRHQPYAVSTTYITPAITFDTCFVEYGPIFDWSRWQKDLTFVGALTLRFTLRKTRG